MTYWSSYLIFANILGEVVAHHLQIPVCMFWRRVFANMSINIQPLSSSETLFTPKDISTKRKIWKTFHGDANVCKNRMHWGRREILEYWIARSDTAPAEDTTSCGIVSKHFDWEFKLLENMRGQETNWLDKENVARENVRAGIKTFVALFNLWIPIPLCFLYRDRSVKWKRDLKELDPRILNFHWRTCYHSCSGN